MFSWELDDFLQESIVSHAITLSITQLIAFLQEKSEDLKWELELCSIVHVAQSVFLVSFLSKRRVFLENEVQQPLHHLHLLAPLPHCLGFRNKS
jgi:hypothetical protein